MRATTTTATTAFSLVALFAGTSMLTGVAGAASDKSIEIGKQAAVERNNGNGLACHLMGDGASPGDIGPPLIAMKARFPDRAKLRARIWDAQVANMGTRMPPFGKHQVLSEAEIDAIVDYLYTL